MSEDVRAAAMREGRALTDNELAIDWARLDEENRILRLGNAMLRDTVQVLCVELESRANHDRGLVSIARAVLGDEKIAPPRHEG